MADTDTLREDVRKAVQELDSKAYPGSQTHARWQTIRAELLRLTGVETELAALKARIEGGIDMGCPVECFVGSRRGRIINPFTPPKWIGQRVRLVEVE